MCRGIAYLNSASIADVLHGPHSPFSLLLSESASKRDDFFDIHRGENAVNKNKKGTKNIYIGHAVSVLHLVPEG